ncbi:MAG TPA: hypothetical protein PKD53_19085 [Chloroflexaceae bacterium]|nr:hypothetical protein [Chloroflexaceae bacterium]
MNHAGRRYVIELGAAIVAYTVTLVVAITVLGWDAPALLRYLVALLPVAAIAYGMLAYMRFLRGIDELQQRIQLSGLAFAVGGTGLITAAWGFLELAGLPHLPTIWVFPILIWLWGLGTALATRRYQ